MKIIVVGAGEIGRHLALSLAREKHDTVVIETDDRLADDLDRQIDAKVITGNGASVNVLVEADAPECDLLFAVTSDNNTNIVSCSIAKQLGAKKVICRVHPELQREEWLFDHRGHFDIDHIFSSERLAAVELSKFIRNPDSLLVEEIARGRIELQQIQISEKSDACNRSLRDLKFPNRIRVGAISRFEGSLIPTADDVLQAGDIVTVFGEPRKLQEIVTRLGNGSANDEPLRTVIFGGGEYGFSLAQMLEGWGARVRIFEADPERCESLTHRLGNTTVLNIDATSLSEMREEQVGEADFFIAATPEDEDNVMTCLQAHNLGAKNCLSIIHRADYADAMSAVGEKIGIMAAVSPREATRKELMRFVTSDRYHIIQSLQAGDVIESTVRDESQIAGQKVSDIDWPPGSGLVALLHGINAAVPAADDVIEAGDTLYAIVSPKAKKKFLKLLSK
ncbi:MAG: Trk system potassium transporter TrkA [Verrucomicrobiota bacterium]